MGSDFNSTTELRICRLEDAVNALSPKLSQLARDISALQQSFMQMAGSVGSQVSSAATGQVFYGVAESGIAAKSGSTAGSANVSIADLDKNGNISASRTVTCFNGTGVAIPAGSTIVVSRNSVGVYMVTNVIC